MVNQINNITISVIAKIFKNKKRLDYVLSKLLPQHSRSQIKNWIVSRKVYVDSCIVIVPKRILKGGELIEIKGINCFNKNFDLFPQNIPLKIIYEDNDIVVIDKSSNIVVHPGVGNYSGTILNALLYRYPFIIKVPRGGIVQRLDKGTTGLMVIAKNIDAYSNLLQSFKKREIFKEYEAIVIGNFADNFGVINLPIRRHNIHRTCMTVNFLGKSAITHYQVLERFCMHTRVRLQLETGRTHQIRVHMAHINHPLVGDIKYGKRSFHLISKNLSNELNSYLSIFSRQALHACALRLIHPRTNIKMQWISPLPEDILHLIYMLRKNNYIC